MINTILFIVIFKIIGAPTWCFVLAWIGFGINAFSALWKLYKAGKELQSNS